MAKEKDFITEEEALAFHMEGKPGKIEITPTKPLLTQRDLSLAYSPGVAYPCLAIEKDPDKAYDYTAKGNLVAVISNGTAVLGLGNLGALASKPVMEGKAVLFKRFADIDSVDIEVDTRNTDEFINAVKYLGPSWGGINLEDIGAPECFIIEQKLKELMDIPVFHDDQHGTAIISAAGLINAAHMTGRKISDMTIVVLGAGAAGIACLELMKVLGIKNENAYLCDKSGIIYQGRNDPSMNQWKSAHAVKTNKRTLADALKGADVFLGLSAKDALTPEMLKGMAKNPIIFAMANPDPEIRPEVARAVRSDAIIATGRSDYPNQVNNVMGFPYIFRGALDVRASEINDEMKIAAAQALAMLAREEVPEEVSAAYSGRKMEFGPDYIIPTPFDPRLMTTIPVAVAKAAVKTGVARKPIKNWDAYKMQLAARRDPTANRMSMLFEKLKTNPQRMIFAEGEDDRIIRAAVQWRDNGYGTPILVGRTEQVKAHMKKMGITDTKGIEITNASVIKNLEPYIDAAYKRLQRHGFLRRDCARGIKNDRNLFAASLLTHGDGDAMITGATRNYNVCVQDVTRIIPTQKDSLLFGLTVMIAKGKTVFLADTTIHELPKPEELCQIAIKAAEKARMMGHEPRVAFLSFSNFGNPMREKAVRVREAVALMDSMKVDFEYEGEMSADVALNKDLMALYPFCRLSGPANVLVMPALHTAHVASKMLQELGDGVTIGPIMMGLEKPVQIVQMNSTVADIMNLAAIAAVDAMKSGAKKAKAPVKATAKSKKWA